jgi:hypothetical protein
VIDVQHRQLKGGEVGVLDHGLLDDLVLDPTHTHHLGALQALMKHLDELILVVVVSFEETTVSLADQFPDSEVQAGHCEGHHEDYVVTSTDEKSRREENDGVFVEVEEEVNQYEDLLIVMIEFVSSSQRILLAIPPDLSMDQGVQGLLVQLIAGYHRQVRPDLAFDVNEAS